MRLVCTWPVSEAVELFHEEEQFTKAFSAFLWMYGHCCIFNAEGKFSISCLTTLLEMQQKSDPEFVCFPVNIDYVEICKLT